MAKPTFNIYDTITLECSMKDELTGDDLDFSDYSVNTAISDSTKQTVKVTVLTDPGDVIQTAVGGTLLDSVAALRHPDSDVTNRVYYPITYGLDTAGDYVAVFWYSSIGTATAGRRQARGVERIRFSVVAPTADDAP